ncbi:MAG: Spy/CpxP family protein refolding chaperone [Alphaproteobacteria bacterium]
MRTKLTLLAAAVALCYELPITAAEAQGVSYAGQQTRDIKALSDNEIAALRNGEGIGLAKAAELNSYPGPRHALDLAGELELSESQRRQLDAIYRQMNTEARTLGAALIERERALDALFATGAVTPENLAVETARIADVQGRLRAVHLAAHLETRALLGPEQVARYNRLRGYDGTAATGHHHPPGHHRH